MGSGIIRGSESMARNILILGASYGSLLSTKLLMAGHNVTLVCRKKTAELINREGTEVRIKLRDCPANWTRPRPPTSTFRVTIWLALPCRSRNTPTTRSGS